jgi:hypothetical protein
MWEKQGLIFCPDNNFKWMRTHAQCPIAYKTTDELIRVFFSTRDKDNISRPIFVELNTNNICEINYIHNKPLMDPGCAGAFDDGGVMPSVFVKKNKCLYMYYMGWSRQVVVPYKVTIGLAVSYDDGLTFERKHEGPILNSSICDPFFVSSPFVMIENEVWKMWYISCTEWKIINGKREPVYLIKYAESHNGIEWKPSSEICIDYKYEGEALARPWIIKENTLYKMWYSTRGSIDYRSSLGQNYTIGYAESLDGKKWKRKDSEAGIDASVSGWDSEMIAYGSIFAHNDKTYMLYNGNGFGRSGFGCASYCGM